MSKTTTIASGPMGKVVYRDIARSDIERDARRLDGVRVSVGYQGQKGGDGKEEWAKSDLVDEAKGSKPKKGKVKSSTAKRKVTKKKRKPRKQGRSTRGLTRVLGKQGLTVVDVAARHEFGIGVPRRATLGPAIRNNEDRLVKMQRRAAQAMLQGKDFERIVRRVGVLAESLVKNEIVDLKLPPLAEVTKQKRFDMTGDRDPNPLVDTGQMKNSVTNEVTGL